MSAWSFPRRAGEQLVLIGSELVTNAVLHARTDLTLTLELEDGRARISVKDQSQAPATLRHYRTDALTGRGLGVVAALSDSWGSAAADGKVVWAEVAAANDAGGEASRPPQLRNGPAPAAAEPPDPPGPLPGVPVETYLELQAHNDALFRELELISIELEAGSPRLAAPWPSWSTSSTGGSGASATATATWSPRPGPAASGPSTSTPAGRRPPPAPPRATWTCWSGPTSCAAPASCSPPSPCPVRELRRWFVEEMVAQLRDGATPTPPPGETVGG